LAGFSGLLASSDYVQAQVDQKAARDVETWWQLVNPPFKNAYYPAAELGGLSYYLPHHWKPANPGDSLSDGDAALIPWRSLPPAFFPQLKAPQALARFVYRTRLPFRTLDSRSRAGFYGSIWGPLPFSISNDPIEVYTLFLCGQRT
jgi:hypothetical protein